MFSSKLSLHDVPLDKELIANYLVKNSYKTREVDPGCDGTDQGTTP